MTGTYSPCVNDATDSAPSTAPAEVASPSYVYLLLSKCGRFVKIGKSISPGTRAAQIGLHLFDLEKSRVMQMRSVAESFSFESLLHLAFYEYRLSVEQALAEVGDHSSGATEWFHANCLPRLERFVAENNDLFCCTPVGNNVLKLTPSAPKVRQRRPDLTPEEKHALDREKCAAIANGLLKIAKISRRTVLQIFSGLALFRGRCSKEFAHDAIALIDEVMSLPSPQVHLIHSTRRGERSYGVSFTISIAWPRDGRDGDLHEELIQYFASLLEPLRAMAAAK